RPLDAPARPRRLVVGRSDPGGVVSRADRAGPHGGVAPVRAVARSLEIEVDARVDLSHIADGRRPPEKWRRHRPAVPQVVGLIRPGLALDVKLDAILAAAHIHAPDGRGAAAAEDADARRQRGLPAER